MVAAVGPKQRQDLGSYSSVLPSTTLSTLSARTAVESYEF